jgi:hypothetical protein
MLVGMSVYPGTQLLRICNDQFRSFLTSEPDIADTILPAFMFRCMSLIAKAQGGAVLVGTSSSIDTPQKSALSGWQQIPSSVPRSGE